MGLNFPPESKIKLIPSSLKQVPGATPLSGAGKTWDFAIKFSMLRKMLHLQDRYKMKYRKEFSPPLHSVCINTLADEVGHQISFLALVKMHLETCREQVFILKHQNLTSEHNALNGLCPCMQLTGSVSRLSFLKKTTIFWKQFYYAKLQRRLLMVFHSLSFRKISPIILIINMAFKNNASAVLVTVR